MVARTAEKRPLGALGRMSVVAALHVGAALLIANSLGLVPGPTETKTDLVIIDDPVVRDDPPPTPPDIKFDDRKVTLVEPAPLPIPDDSSDPPPTITGEFRDPNEFPRSTGSADPVPSIVGARPDARHPLSQPPYNPTDIREGNEGAADVEVYVLPNGRVSDARIVKSSGFPRLDRATLDEAKRNWRLIPATRDGVAIPQWYRLRVVFKLNRQ